LPRHHRPAQSEPGDPHRGRGLRTAGHRPRGHGSLDGAVIGLPCHAHCAGGDRAGARGGDPLLAGGGRMSAIPAVPAVEAPDRRKPIVAICDLDRTITRRGTWTPCLLSVAGRRPRKLLAVAPILLAALRYRRGRIGRSAVKEIMLRKVLTGIPRTEIAAEAKTFVDRLVRTGLCPGALQAIERHRRAGHRLVLATAAVD